MLADGSRSVGGKECVSYETIGVGETHTLSYEGEDIEVYWMCTEYTPCETNDDCLEAHGAPICAIDYEVGIPYED